MPSPLDDIAAKETAAYQKLRGKVFLECAIGSLLQAYPIAEVAKMLREQAEHLEEFG